MFTARNRAARPSALVLGGTGAVGRAVVTELKAAGVAVTVIARNPAGATGPAGVDAVAMDVADKAALRRLLAERIIDVAILCVEPPDVAVHSALLDAGVGIVDVTANPDRMVAIHELGERARDQGVSVLLSVGVAPGLTNTAALAVTSDLGEVDEIDLTVLLGVGEAHGAEGLRWLAESLGDERVAHVGPKRARVPGFGTRMTHPAPFSDQFTLRRTLGIPNVTTRMALDSRVATAFLFSRFVERAGAPLLRAAGSMLESSRLGARLGGDGFVVMARGRRGSRTATRWVSGRGQSRSTALVASVGAVSILEGEVPAGVHHLEGLPPTIARVEGLAARGLTFGRDLDSP